MKPWQDKKSTGRTNSVDMSKMGAMPIVIGRKKIKISERKNSHTQVYQTFSSSALTYIFNDVIMSTYVQVLFHLGYAKLFIFSPWSEEK